jgi:hypothetical protein
MQKYKAAIVNINTEKQIPQPPEQTAFFKTYFSGFKNLQADDRKAGRMSDRVGKDPFSKSAFRVLAKLALNSGHLSTQLFLHPYLILDWNLMSRSESCGNLMFQHIHWGEDALCIQ